MSDLLRTRGLLRAERLSADRWRSQAERYARLLARDRFALARVKAERDDLRAEVRERRAAEKRAPDLSAVKRALEEHELIWVNREVGWACGCDDDGRLDLFSIEVARAHVACAIITDALGGDQ